MIDGVGGNGTRQVTIGRGPIERSTAAAKAGDGKARNLGTILGSLAAELAAAAGPPVDAGKIAAIRAGIAAGRYAANPTKIAERMIILDLPPERVK